VKKYSPIHVAVQILIPQFLGSSLALHVPVWQLLAVGHSQLSLPGLSQARAEGKRFLSSVVELPARAPCWLPLRQAASPVYFSWPIHDCFMGSLPLFLHLLPFCFSLSSN